jgi:putative flippase GtrA
VTHHGSALFRRWVKFNVVGAMGMAVQFTILALLTNLFGVQYLVATAVAVECTVLHNFAWHERFTWADRKLQNSHAVARRLVQFNLTTGVVSIGGNLLLMRILVGLAHTPLLLANCASVAACSVVNYLVNDRWVFRAMAWRAAGHARDVQLTSLDWPRIRARHQSKQRISTRP